nr:MAG TPA: hypothetical protein [Siphoviridae sp. ctqtA1]
MSYAHFPQRTVDNYFYCFRLDILACMRLRNLLNPTFCTSDDSYIEISFFTPI